MKKNLIIMSVSLMSLVASAQSYRGMVEFGVGVAGGGPSYSNEMGTFKLNNGFLGSFTTSHGCQITPAIFIGAGVGVDIGWEESFKTPILDSKYNKEDFEVDNYNDADINSLKIPVFVDFRWDLDIRRKVTPFIDLKFGYSINPDPNLDYFWGPSSFIEVEDEYHGEYVDKYGYGPVRSSVSLKGVGSFFFKPTIGVRIKGRKNCGLNIGVSYEVSQSRYSDNITRLVGYRYYDDYWKWDLEYDDDIYKRFTRGALMFNIGFDF